MKRVGWLCWKARMRPLSRAGSNWLTPSPVSDSSASNHYCGGLVAVDSVTGSVCEWFYPVLFRPSAGVRRIDSDHGDVSRGGHSDEAVAELGSGDSRDRSAKVFTAFSAPHGFSASGACVVEVQVLDTNRCTVVCLGVVDDARDDVAYLGITVAGGAAQGEVEAFGGADDVTVGVDDGDVHVSIIEVHSTCSQGF